jgi:hypothetical protein
LFCSIGNIYSLCIIYCTVCWFHNLQHMKNRWYQWNKKYGLSHGIKKWRNIQYTKNRWYQWNKKYGLSHGIKKWSSIILCLELYIFHVQIPRGIVVLYCFCNNDFFLLYDMYCSNDKLNQLLWYNKVLLNQLLWYNKVLLNQLLWYNKVLLNQRHKIILDILGQINVT